MIFFYRTRATILLFRQLAVLLRSGMPLPEALGSLDDFPYAAVRSHLRKVNQDLASGMPLAEAVSRHPELFGRIPPVLWSRSMPLPQLGQMFYEFAEEMEKISAMKRRMKWALAYPLTTLTIGFLVFSVLLVFVIPAFEKMYADFGGTLPGPTRALIELSYHQVELALVMFIALVGVLILWDRKPEWTFAIGCQLPIIGTVLRRSSVYLFARNLSLFIRLGMPQSQALHTSAERLRFIPFSRRLRTLVHKRSLKETLGDTRVFPRLFLQVVGVGERSGNVGEVLLEFAGYYEKEVDTAYFRLLLLTEVLALVAVALVIGWSVMAMYLPIFNLAGAVAG
jgi:type IV pilus assembly protein PilC